MTINTMSKMGLAFAVGVALSAGYVAIGAQRSVAPEIVVVQERCEQGEERAVPLPEVESTPALPEGLGHNPPYYVTDQGELEAMARRCEVRDDDPFVALDDAIAAALGLSASERDAWELARARLTGAEAATEYILLHEIDPDGASDTTLTELLDNREGRAESDRAIHEQLAYERAGLRATMTREQLEQSDVWTRALRFRLTTGDQFAAELATELGRVRVEELRRKFGGWPGFGKRVISCEESAVLKAAPDGVMIDGDVDRDIIRRIVRAHRSEIRSCYESSDAASEGIEGKFEVEFVIGSDGKVGRVSAVDRSKLPDPDASECVRTAVEGWLFLKPARGEVKVMFPFEFKPD